MLYGLAADTFIADWIFCYDHIVLSWHQLLHTDNQLSQQHIQLEQMNIIQRYMDDIKGLQDDIKREKKFHEIEKLNLFIDDPIYRLVFVETMMRCSDQLLRFRNHNPEVIPFASIQIRPNNDQISEKIHKSRAKHLKNLKKHEDEILLIKRELEKIQKVNVKLEMEQARLNEIKKYTMESKEIDKIYANVKTIDDLDVANTHAQNVIRKKAVLELTEAGYDRMNMMKQLEQKDLLISKLRQDSLEMEEQVRLELGVAPWDDCKECKKRTEMIRQKIIKIICKPKSTFIMEGDDDNTYSEVSYRIRTMTTAFYEPLITEEYTSSTDNGMKISNEDVILNSIHNVDFSIHD